MTGDDVCDLAPGFISDTYRAAALLGAQSDIEVIEVEDYIANPKPNGYRSFHMIVEIPAHCSDRVEHVPAEWQIRTIAQGFWACLEHEIHYKYSRAVPRGLLTELTDAAVAAHRLDMTTERLHHKAARLRTTDPKAPSRTRQTPNALRTASPHVTAPVNDTTHRSHPKPAPRDDRRGQQIGGQVTPRGRPRRLAKPDSPESHSPRPRFDRPSTAGGLSCPHLLCTSMPHGQRSVAYVCGSSPPASPAESCKGPGGHDHVK